MTTRKKPKRATEAEVLIRSRRRCCICFGLNRDVSVKVGQIAHLDGDNSNSTADNLAFLCFEHHDQYDSKTSQSKNFTINEVKAYRDELHENLLPIIEAGTIRQPPDASPPGDMRVGAQFDEKQRQELKEIILEVFSETEAPLRNISGLAHRIDISRAITERLLFEMAQEGSLRVDRPRGSRKKTYSLASSWENRLLDTFVATLGEEVESEERYLVSKNREFEFDSLIKTTQGTMYAVETMFARKSINRYPVEMKLKRLARAKYDLGFENALSVLLVGITGETKPHEQDLKSLEKEGVLIRYVVLDEGAQSMAAADGLQSTG